MRVVAGRKYRYNPTLLDMVDARTNLRNGEIVRVVKLHGAPPPNTMGQCHVEDVQGQFLGMVSCNSLEQIVWKRGKQ